MRKLNELNISGGAADLKMPDVKAFESEIGKNLPESYIQFLEFSNGGNPELDAFFLKAEDSGERWSAGTFYHLMQNVNDMDDVLWAFRNYRQVLSSDLMPIAFDGFGNQICLDLKTQKILLWVHDDASRNEVADSFEEFIDSLHLNPDYK